MKIASLLIMLMLLQGCTVLGMIADHKAGESGERHGSHSGGLKAGSHIDETVLSSIKSGEFPDASPYESCNDLSGKRKEQCAQKTQAVTDSIRKHIKQKP